MSDIDAVLPAWSEPFHRRGGPGAAPALHLPVQPDRTWAYGDGSGRGVRVAVVDSGIDADHPDVGGVAEYVAVDRDDAEESGVRFTSGRHDDLYGHGTACAAIIRALAPRVELVSVRVLGANLKGSAGAFAHGLEWCIEHGIDVINLSMSTASDRWAETFWDLVDYATYRRVLLVSAMNNERKRTIPSELAGVFSVACAPGVDRERVWRNPDGPAEWGAAGIDVDVAWMGGSTIRATGNSFAAPVVAGHLARIVGAHPGITPWQAKTILAELAVNAT
ncbi:MAG: S8 family serine peptidase [Ilumatobacteraceae bacterium]